MIEARDGATIVRKEYDLSSLILQEEQFTGFLTAPDMTEQSCQYNNTDSVTIEQSDIELEDDVDGSGTDFTGGIAGEVFTYTDTEDRTRYALGLKVNDDLVNENCGLDYTFYDVSGEILATEMIQSGNFPQDGYVALDFFDSANQRAIDPSDVRSIEITFSDYSEGNDLFIEVVYETNLRSGH